MSIFLVLFLPEDEVEALGPPGWATTYPFAQRLREGELEPDGLGLSLTLPSTS